ncbi:MAG: hypothetical protein Q4E99_05185 [Bacillota bacterium]|nr:hypothetical protein [Bacillota bacterium]
MIHLEGGSGTTINLSDKKIPKKLSDLLEDDEHRTVTNTEKQKLAGIETGAEVNKVNDVKVDGQSALDANKIANIDLSGKLDCYVLDDEHTFDDILIGKTIDEIVLKPIFQKDLAGNILYLYYGNNQGELVLYGIYRKIPDMEDVAITQQTISLTFDEDDRITEYEITDSKQISLNEMLDKEDITNKVTSLSSLSTNTQYPSAKAVWDLVGTKQDKSNFELIEKIIVGYSITTEEPEDWDTNYTAYFTNTGTARNPVYTPVSGETAPIWGSGIYFKYSSDAVKYISRGIEPDGTPYDFSGMAFNCSFTPYTSSESFSLRLAISGGSAEAVRCVEINEHNVIGTSSKWFQAVARKEGFWGMTFNNNYSISTMIERQIQLSNCKYLKISQSNYIPAGSVITIYGKRG